MALSLAIKLGATEVAAVARAVGFCKIPQRTVSQVSCQSSSRLSSPLLQRGLPFGLVECSPANPAAGRSVSVPPRSPKKPVVLPTLQTLLDYNLPSLVKPSAAIGDIKAIIAPTTDANSNGIEKSDPTPTVEKRAAALIQIRKKKMKKHKLRKLRKRMHFLWAKQRFRREKKKEQVFRAELLAQIHEAQAFDAEKYVTGVLDKIRNRPQPETPEERREKFLELMRKYRSNVEWIKPKFD
ncbi:uncharacterized protein ISCGN_023165 [Ixodes scapularis]